MSYKVTYSRETVQKDFFCRIQIPIAGLLLLLALINGLYGYSGKFSEIKERIMPWTQPQVREAFLIFRESLANGEPVTESVEVFCAEIFKGNAEKRSE